MTREPANENRSPLTDALRDLRIAAVELIRVIELEASGIRDGDGYWHGSDGLTGRIDEVTSIGQRIEVLRSDGKPANTKHAPLLDDEIPF